MPNLLMSSKYLPACTVGVFLVYDLVTSDKTSNLWVNILLSFFVSFFCTNETKKKKELQCLHILQIQQKIQNSHMKSGSLDELS